MKKFIGLVSILFTSQAYSFDLYNSVSWESHKNKSGKVVQSYDDTRRFINAQGMKHIRVFYHNSFLTDGKADSDKIKKIAILSRQNPEFPISFDIEMGNNNKPETVLPRVIEVLDLYRKHGGKAPVGVYALLPQNTHGGKNAANNPQKYITLNKQYEIIASKVDFLSPVFYNYDQDYNTWKKSVDLGMSEAHKYASKHNSKIIPYFSISYFVREKSGRVKYIVPLDQNETIKRLTYLKAKGADGLIIWDSSRYREISGKKPTADTNQGWLKGVTSFLNKLG